MNYINEMEQLGKNWKVVKTRVLAKKTRYFFKNFNRNRVKILSIYTKSRKKSETKSIPK